MKIINVPCKNDIREEVVYNINDFPYEKIQAMPTIRHKKKTYINTVNAFDIETSTVEPRYKIKQVNNRNVKDYARSPFGFMYQWQMCINGYVVFGRRWEEFTFFLNKLRTILELSENKRLVIYVHNLAYEFQFIKDFLNITEIFAKDKRKPMKFFSDGIEFRCSYFLSNMSLGKFCENSKSCIHYKLEDKYDYSIIRTPETKLTEIEESYCYNDVKGLCECVEDKLKDNNDNIGTIPLTSTGYVRREYRHQVSTKKNQAQFKKLALNSDEYQMLKRAFRGGDTHANRFFANMILYNVHSFDISSSYPSTIAMDDFPIGKFMECNITSQSKLEEYCKKYCVVMDIAFFNISTKIDEFMPYVDIAHCTKRYNVVNDNGRVLSADYIELTITNIDLDIIRESYDYDGFVVSKAIYSRKGKLPTELRQAMMKFYYDKTMLRGIDDKVYEYMKKKNILNSTYGMMVTDICHSEISYDFNEQQWKEEKPNIDEALTKFYDNRNNFLSYQWGVFVTANARKRLRTMVRKVGADIVYMDTDSIKFINTEHVKDFNEINEKLKKQAENNDVPAYVDRNGERFYLGTWDNDGEYKRFKTLGAKKYCYEKESKDDKTKFEITVSGMSKKLGAKAVGSIENFKIGKTYENVGRTTSWYNDEKIHEITINNVTFTTASNIGILENTYTLGVTNEYWELIFNNI